MAHHKTEATPNQGQSPDKSSLRGSGNMTGAPDQGGSGHTGSQPRMDEQSQDSGYAGASQGKVGTADLPAAEDALDPRGSKPTPR